MAKIKNTSYIKIFKQKIPICEDKGILESPDTISGVGIIIGSDGLNGQLRHPYGF